MIQDHAPLPFLIYRDKTEEFKEKKLKYVTSYKKDLENLQLEFKKISLNVNTVFNDQKIEELSRIVVNCTICGSTFGKIFNKKQKCILCNSIVCSSCNVNQIPLNIFETNPLSPTNQQHNSGHKRSNSGSTNKDGTKDIINTCKQCFSVAKKLLNKRELDIVKEQSLNSNFSRFYEIMHLNTLDLNKNLPKFKILVDSIQDSSNQPEITRAMDIEPIVTMHLKELESGIKQLKLLQSPNKMQSMVIQNLKHYFVHHLQTALPDFRLYTREFQRKKQLPPHSRSIDIKKDNNNTTTITITTTKDKSIVGKDTQGTSPHSPPSSFSSFFSSVSKSIVEGVNSLTSKNDDNNSSNNNNNNTTDYNVEIMDPNQSTVISVMPAIVPINGFSLVTIIGTNLLKKNIKIIIGSMEIKGLNYHDNAILLQTPPMANEGQVELIIKEGNNILSNQFLFYTNSCFQSDKDLTNANKYAAESYQSAITSDKTYKNITIVNNNGGSDSDKLSFINDNYVDNDDDNLNSLRDDITNGDDDELIENILNLDDLDKYNNPNNNNYNFNVNVNQQQQQQQNIKKIYPSTGTTSKDIIIEEISPLISPTSGIKVSIYFKNPVNNSILVNVGNIPIQYVDISDQNRRCTFLSPPLKEGRYSIEIIFNSKTLEIPQILTYENTHPLPPVNLNFEENKYLKSNINNTNNNNNNNINNLNHPPNVIVPKKRYLSEQLPTVSKSSRVWGTKSTTNEST